MKPRREFLKGAAIGMVSFSGLGLTSNTDPGKNFNIRDLGAKPDGSSLNTVIIQKAIDDCSKSGGGTVLFPPGKYLTGSIFLKDGVTLFLEKGATLLGSTDINDYLSVKPDYSALRTNTATVQLIYAEKQKDIGIRGEGTIDGQGGVFLKQGNEDEGTSRPHCIQFINCQNIKIEGVFMTNSGAWMQHYLACDKVQIRGIRVQNHCNYNNDGIDIDGCSDVIISDCIVDSDDDAICLKSTSPRPCINVLVNNCHVRSFCNALKLGTESTGGFRNIVFSNCIVSPCEEQKRYYGHPLGQSAISVEMVDGGALEQVTIDNISIEDTGCPVFIRLGNRARKHAPDAPEPGMGTLKNVRISNIIAKTTSPVTSNITGIVGNYAENIHIENFFVTILNQGAPENANMIVPENDKAYPRAEMFGQKLPASVFFVRHVRNIRFFNLHLIIGKDNYLPAFVFDDVKNAKIFFTELETANNNDLIKKSFDSEGVRVIN